MEPELFFNTTTTQGNTMNLYDELSRSSTWEAFTEAPNYYEGGINNWEYLTFRDSQSGEDLFVVPGWNGYRTIKEFWDESIERGYLSFIEDEVHEKRDLTATSPYITEIVEEYNHDVFSEFGTFLGRTEYNVWLYFKQLDFVKNYNLGYKRYIVNLSSVAGEQEDWHDHYKIMKDKYEYVNR